ncbi:pre-piRNA 3'-exonuclease trimmer-like isoform X1 [Vespula maculifrons]|uniref:Pre-piRNA 3'-exonuclease trimmer-like isoform X1 n=1 Tax=Vespula maculifrons TaxID=7453 RepID=A0ABD2CSV5_VESMC
MMISVNKQNFQKLYPTIKTSLENAQVIAIDAEFSGLESDDSSKSSVIIVIICCSLFDTIEERYQKLRKNSEKFTIVQFGITCIEQVPCQNVYNTKIFKFCLFPASIPIKNRQFLWQVAAIEFLSLSGFNFNKVVYDGISYLNEVEEFTFKQYLEDNNMIRNINNMSYKEGDEIKRAIDSVANWLEFSGDPDEDPEYIVLKISVSSVNLQYLLQKILRSRFLRIWTTYNNEEITVIKVSLEIRRMFEREERDILNKALLDSYIGFSKVFKLLVELKKPIVGHNILLDLIYMYKLFYKPLPKRYNEFKVEIHRLFPIIYDTKYLSYQLRDEISLFPPGSPYTLDALYKFFSEERKRFILNSPIIETNYKLGDVMLHDAGWDSYFTGYIFIKMAHVIAVKKYGKGLEYRPVTNTEVMSSLQEYLNCINLSRASTFYLKLDGKDPKSERPQWLFVRTSVNYDIDQIIQKLSAFGTVDVKSFIEGCALVAVANHGSARNILNHFYNHKDIYIVPYNPIKHSLSVKYLLIVSAILSGGVVAWYGAVSKQGGRPILDPLQGQSRLLVVAFTNCYFVARDFFFVRLNYEVSDLTSTQIIIGQLDNNRAHTNRRYFLAYSIEFLRFNEDILRFMEIARNGKMFTRIYYFSQYLQ